MSDDEKPVAWLHERSNTVRGTNDCLFVKREGVRWFDEEPGVKVTVTPLYAEAALTRLREENARQAAEIERKNAALEPFAKMAKLIDGPFGPRSRTPDEGTFQSGGAWTENGKPRTLTWGDFRRARAAAEKGETE